MHRVLQQGTIETTSLILAVTQNSPSHGTRVGHDDCRTVSITMKNWNPESVLGAAPGSPLAPQDGSLGSLGSIRVGSFSGKPVTPKVA